MKKLAAYFLVTLFFINAISASPSPYSPQMIKAFADELFTEGFFDEAESEYKRFLFSIKEPEFSNGTEISSPEIQSVFTSLTNIYHVQKNTDGIKWLHNNFYPQMETVIQEKLDLITAQNLFAERKSQAFSAFFNLIMPEFPAFSKEFKLLLPLSEAILLQNISQTKILADQAAETTPLFSPLQNLCTDFKLKKPGFALFLSAIIPGAGKIYGGTWRGFLTDFLAVGSFAAATVYTGIQSEWKSWRPYVFGTCGLVMYIVNLYGSYQNVKRYNAAQFQKLYEETDKLYEKLY